MPDFFFVCLNKSRVQENRLYWRALLGVTFFQEDQVKPFGFTSLSKDDCLMIQSLLIAKMFVVCGLGLPQGLLRGGRWCCSFTRRRRVHRSTLSSFTSLGGNSLILVCVSFPLSWLLILHIAPHQRSYKLVSCFMCLVVD